MPLNAARSTSSVSESAISKMSWRPLEKFAAPKLADKFSVTRRDFAANGDDMRTPFDLESFERTVIEIHLVRFRRDFSAIIRIVYDQIGVAAERDCSFARK